MNIAVFPGSFCPYTKGHEDIVSKALPLFDEIIIAVGSNSEKHNIFSETKRINWIKEIYKNEQKIKVLPYTGLTVDFCKSVCSKHIIRGIRNNIDFIKEQELAKINKKLYPDIETVFFTSSQDYEIVSSSFVRELWKNGKDYSEYMSYELPDYSFFLKCNSI